VLLAKEIPKYRDELATSLPELIKGKIQNNYAMAEVYFQTLNVINIKQTPMFDVRCIFKSFHQGTLKGEVSLYH
jgi:hypothetical protein